MKAAWIELRYAEAALSPVHRLLCTAPALEREVILGGHVDDGVETITSFVSGEPQAYESLLADLESVLEYELTPADDGFFVYLRRELGERGTSLLEALGQETVVLVPPIEVRADRTMRLTLVGHPDDLGTVLESVPEGITLEVLRVRGDVAVAADPFTDRQREALEVAWELGYYEVPRRAGIEDVAAALDCAVSTASELLRRGEARAIGSLLESEG